MPTTRPGQPPPEKEKLDKYMCTRCGKIYVRQKANFSASQSPLFIESGYLPVCNNCMDHLYDHYKEVLGSGEAAMQRICLKFDIYWNPNIWGMVSKVNSSASRVRQYIGKTFLIRNLGKSYDDTLDEQKAQSMPVQLQVNEQGEDEIVDMVGERVDVNTESVLFWGSGFEADTYRELDLRFDRWTKDLPKPLPIVDESLYKQICIQEVMINRNIAAGKDVEKGQSALNTLLGSLNVKPNQKKDDGNSELESTPLGVWAKIWEEDRPIPDDVPDPSIIKYITTWLFGHLGKAFGLKNIHSKMYETEIEKYRVTKPEYEGEDDDEVLVDIFGGEDNGGRDDESGDTG